MGQTRPFGDVGSRSGLPAENGQATRFYECALNKPRAAIHDGPLARCQLTTS
jgi:hypothetical protein